ncbi:hypothetical protein KEM48_007090 [Puccinia striiformis f. sp. tritici PST-130]|nr:hypothetical protein KEM48_007090 [Puccinia striiformis f. sp. tritici PST-130]
MGQVESPNRFGSNNNNNNNQNIKSAEEENSTNQMSSVQVGEDSYFLRTDSLGVADGVEAGAGNQERIRFILRKLMHHCSTELSRYQDIDDSIHESKLEGLLGSTTALIAVLRDDDCGLPTWEIVVAHRYQLQSTPARDAQRYNIKVQKDDIVILGSDGLADNLFDEDIRRSPKYTTQTNGEQHETRTVVEDQEAVTSPFSQRANEEGIHYVGGKNDDISVLVAIVGDQNDA